MDEQVIKAIFQGKGFDELGDFESFKSAFVSDQEFRRRVWHKDFRENGTFDEFEQFTGLAANNTQPAPAREGSRRYTPAGIVANPGVNDKKLTDFYKGIDEFAKVPGSYSGVLGTVGLGGDNKNDKEQRAANVLNLDNDPMTSAWSSLDGDLEERKADYSNDPQTAEVEIGLAGLNNYRNSAESIIDRSKIRLDYLYGQEDSYRGVKAPSDIIEEYVFALTTGDQVAANKIVTENPELMEDVNTKNVLRAKQKFYESYLAERDLLKANPGYVARKEELKKVEEAHNIKTKAQRAAINSGAIPPGAAAAVSLLVGPNSKNTWKQFAGKWIDNFGAIITSPTLRDIGRDMKDFNPKSTDMQGRVIETFKEVSVNGKDYRVIYEDDKIFEIRDKDGFRLEPDENTFEKIKGATKGIESKTRVNARALGSQIVDVGLDMLPVMAIVVATRGAATGLGMSANAGAMVGTVLGSAIQVSGGLYEEMLKHPDLTPAEAVWDTRLIALGVSLIALGNPLEAGLVNRMATGSFAKFGSRGIPLNNIIRKNGIAQAAARKNVNRLLNKEITKKQLNWEITKDVSRALMKEPVEEMAQEVFEIGSKFAIDHFNDDNEGEFIDNKWPGWRETAEITLVSAAVGFLGGAGAIRTSRSQFINEAMESALRNPDLVNSHIKELQSAVDNIQNGAEKDKAQEYVDNITTRWEVIKNNVETVQGLSGKQRGRLGVLISDANVIEGELSRITNPAFKTAKEDQLKDIQTEIEQIVNPEAEAAAPAAETTTDTDTGEDTTTGTGDAVRDMTESVGRIAEGGAEVSIEYFEPGQTVDIKGEDGTQSGEITNVNRRADGGIHSIEVDTGADEQRTIQVFGKTPQELGISIRGAQSDADVAVAEPPRIATEYKVGQAVSGNVEGTIVDISFNILNKDRTQNVYRIQIERPDGTKFWQPIQGTTPALLAAVHGINIHDGESTTEGESQSNGKSGTDNKKGTDSKRGGVDTGDEESRGDSSGVSKRRGTSRRPATDQSGAGKTQKPTNAKGEEIDEQAERARQAAKVGKRTEEDKRKFPLAEEVESNEQFLKNKAAYQQSDQRVDGKKATRRAKDGSKIKGKWVLTNKNEVFPSHQPFSFSKTEGVPVGPDGRTLNPNDYENSKNKRDYQIDIAGHFNESAIENPIIIDQNGVVKSGNGRTISRQMSNAKQAKEYMDALKDRAEEFGFTREQVEAIGDDNAILVFEAEGTPVYTAKEYDRFNTEDTKQDSPLEQTITLSKTLDQRTINQIAKIFDEADVKSELKISDIRKLRDIMLRAGIISGTTEARYFEDGKLTPEGSSLLENILLATVFGETELRILANKTGLRKKLATNAVRLIKNSKKDDNANVIPLIREALQLVNDSDKYNGDYTNKLYQYITQRSDFDKINANPEAILYALLINDTSALRNILNKVNKVGGKGDTADAFGTAPTAGEILTHELEKFKNQLDKDGQRVYKITEEVRDILAQEATEAAAAAEKRRSDQRDAEKDAEGREQAPERSEEEAEVAPLIQGIVSEEEWADFVDNEFVSQERLEIIANIMADNGLLSQEEIGMSTYKNSAHNIDYPKNINELLEKKRQEEDTGGKKKPPADGAQDQAAETEGLSNIDFNTYDGLTREQQQEQLAKALGWNSYSEMTADDSITKLAAKADFVSPDERDISGDFIANIDAALREQDYEEANILYAVLQENAEIVLSDSTKGKTRGKDFSVGDQIIYSRGFNKGDGIATVVKVIGNGNFILSDNKTKEEFPVNPEEDQLSKSPLQQPGDTENDVFKLEQEAIDKLNKEEAAEAELKIPLEDRPVRDIFVPDSLLRGKMVTIQVVNADTGVAEDLRMDALEAQRDVQSMLEKMDSVKTCL